MNIYCHNNPIMFIDPTGECYEYVSLPGSVMGNKWFLKRSIPGVPDLCGNCNTYTPGSLMWQRMQQPAPPPPPPPPSSTRYFNTSDAAAIDFVLRYGAVSISSRQEYGAVIVPIELDGKIMYTYPDPDIGPVRVNANGSCEITWDVNAVAYVHTHGQYVVDVNNYFSDVDKYLAINSSVFGYVGTPSGTVREYNPWSGGDSIIFNNAPRDPNHP